MERFVARDSPRKMLMMLAACVVGLAFFAWVATELPSWGSFLGIIVAVGLVLFSLYVVILAYRALNPGERIVIDDTGIFQKGWKTGAIPWRDVESAYVKRSGALDYLCLRVRNEDAYVKDMSDLAKAGLQKAGLSPVSLLAAGTDCSFDRLVEIVARKTLVEREEQRLP